MSIDAVSEESREYIIKKPLSSSSSQRIPPLDAMQHMQSGSEQTQHFVAVKVPERDGQANNNWMLVGIGPDGRAHLHESRRNILSTTSLSELLGHNRDKKEQIISMAISLTPSIDALSQVVYELHAYLGKDSFYDAPLWKYILQAVGENPDENIALVTKTGGLQNRVLELIRQEQEKTKVQRHAEIEFWSKHKVANGDACLRNKEELLPLISRTIAKGNLIFHVSSDFNVEKLDDFEIGEIRVRHLLGIANLAPIHVLIVPHGRYIANQILGIADHFSGTHIILDGSQPTPDATNAHEFTHAALVQQFGASKSSTMAEGAAMLVSHILFPRDTLNNFRTEEGQRYVFDVIKENQQPVLSGTQLLKLDQQSQTPHLTGVDENISSYGIGGALAEYIYTTHGMKTFIKMYKTSCAEQLYNTKDGSPLILNGKIVEGVNERDIIAASLLSAGIIRPAYLPGHDPAHDVETPDLETFKRNLAAFIQKECFPPTRKNRLLSLLRILK